MTDAQTVFESLSTQMRLHIDRIKPGQARYRFETLSDQASLDTIFTCYRATENQVECSMKNPLARPMTVGEVRQRLDAFEPANRGVFHDYATRFRTDAAPVEMTIPAYGLGKAGYLLLDGNHRATAASMAGRPFSIRLAVLEGPIDRRILRDLKFWDGGVWRFAARLGLGAKAS